MTGFSNLTPAQRERLAMLAEECGEVIQAIGKILRHGYDNCHPKTRIGNAKALSDELCQVAAVAAVLRKDGVPDYSLEDMHRAWAKKLKYSHHQKTTP